MFKGFAVLLVFLATACGPIEPQWLVAGSGTTSDLLAVHGSSATNVWAVGRSGLVLRFDGTTWQQVETNLPTVFSGVFAASPSEVWVVGEEGVVLRWNGVAFTRVSHSNVDFRAVFGVGANDIYFASNGSLEHWNGSAFKPVNSIEGASTYRVDATGFSGGAAGIYAATPGRIYSLTPTNAQELKFETSGSWRVVVANTDTMWVIDNSGPVLRRDGSNWVVVDFPRKDALAGSVWVSGGWANSANDVWFFAEKGWLWHWDGSEVRTVHSNVAGLHGIWGTAGDMWVAGTGGTLARRHVK